MLTLEEMYPPYALRIACGPVEMRVLRDEDLPAVIELIRSGIGDPELPIPFTADWHLTPYTPGEPDGMPASSLRVWWKQRATYAPDDWHLTFAVRRDGGLVGVQDIWAKDFPQVRHVESGSWLGRSHHGRGTGTLMRQLVVGFAFDELGALECGSGYVAGNHASAAVSRKVGYLDNGRVRSVQHTRDGRLGVEEQAVLVTPATFVRAAEPVTVEGADAVRRFLGITR